MIGDMNWNQHPTNYRAPSPYAMVKAFKEGREAYENEQHKDTNPYFNGTYLWDEWNRGHV